VLVIAISAAAERRDLDCTRIASLERAQDLEREIQRTSDDGRGISNAPSDGKSIDLDSMRYRAHARQVRSKIDSIPGEGTVVACEIPERLSVVSMHEENLYAERVIRPASSRNAVRCGEHRYKHVTKGSSAIPITATTLWRRRFAAASGS